MQTFIIHNVSEIVVEATELKGGVLQKTIRIIADGNRIDIILFAKERATSEGHENLTLKTGA
jgi:hypothetical protein